MSVGMVQGGSVAGPVDLLSERIISSQPIQIVGVVRIVAEYVTENHFGAQKWREHGVKIPSEIAYKEGFEAWWFGPDSEDPSKRVYDTHLPPVLGQAKRSLQLLMQNGLKFSYAPKLQRDKYIEIETPCWLVMRKGVFARAESWEKQKQCIKDLNAKGAGYEEEPNAIDLATIVLARNKLKGERHLGDESGTEGEWTFSHCMLNGRLKVLGGFAVVGVRFCGDIDFDIVNDGLVGLRKL
jgi:hypothetical protein